MEHRGPKKPARRAPPKVDERLRKKADELHQQGMPYQMAMAIAHGRLDLSEALERMATKDRVNKLMERHELSRALATQVAVGHADLDLVLARRRFELHRAENRDRTCLEATGEPVVVQLQDRSVKGVVERLEPYTFTLRTDQGVEEIHKLEAKYGYSPADWKVVKKAVKSDKAASPERPATRPQDRYTCSDKRLFQYVDTRQEVAVTLLDGDVIKGVVLWFGRYEFGLEVKSGVVVTVFRHAMRHVR